MSISFSGRHEGCEGESHKIGGQVKAMMLLPPPPPPFVLALCSTPYEDGNNRTIGRAKAVIFSFPPPSLSSRLPPLAPASRLNVKRALIPIWTIIN